MNLESLRQKRIKRLGVKNPGHSGQRRIFFILDRGTRKFKNDLGLWMQYIEYARSQKSTKKLSQIFTSVLRLHPAKPELWIYAARHAVDDNADMTSARSYMQRGLRFNKHEKLLWVEYAKLEMIYVAKILARQQILGLHEERAPKKHDTDDIMMLPDITAEDVNPESRGDDSLDEDALNKLANSPVMNGAIPMAIFDAAMLQFPTDDAFPAKFFDMFAEFDKAPCLGRILEHVTGYMVQHHPTSAWTGVCKARSTLSGVDETSAEFAVALGKFFGAVKDLLQSSSSKQLVAEQVILCLVPYLRIEDLDSGIQTVVRASLRKYCATLEQTEGRPDSPGVVVAKVVDSLAATGRAADSQTLASFALEMWPLNSHLAEIGKGSHG
jgi:U3 small nucleolar RNA-associated protein 6